MRALNPVSTGNNGFMGQCTLMYIDVSLQTSIGTYCTRAVCQELGPL